VRQDAKGRKRKWRDIRVSEKDCGNGWDKQERENERERVLRKKKWEEHKKKMKGTQRQREIGMEKRGGGRDLKEKEVRA
jgi:hypothetical protein